MKILPKELHSCLLNFTKIVFQNWLISTTTELKMWDKRYPTRKEKKVYGIGSTGDLEKTDEYKKCIEILSEIPSIKNFLVSLKSPNREITEWDIESHIRSQYLSPLIIQIAEKSDGKFSDDAFEKIYKSLENFLLSDIVESKIIKITPLPNLQTEIDNIELNNGLSIRRISKEEREKIFLDFSQTGFQSYLGFSRLPSSNFVIESVRGNKKPEANAEDVVLALTLFKPCVSIGVHQSFAYRQLWKKTPFSVSSESSVPFLPFSLTKQETKDFLDYWKTEFLPILKEENHFMNIVFSRIQDYRLRKNWIMGIVDLAICLEAMYLKNNAELSYRLSHRCATLLGHKESGEEKEQIRKFVKKFYDLRSDLVHGRTIEDETIIVDKDSKYTLFFFIPQSFEYVRESIRLFLSFAKNSGLDRRKHDELLKVLDESIYNEKTLTEYLEKQYGILSGD